MKKSYCFYCSTNRFHYLLKYAYVPVLSLFTPPPRLCTPFQHLAELVHPALLSGLSGTREPLGIGGLQSFCLSVGEGSDQPIDCMFIVDKVAVSEVLYDKPI